MTLNLKNGYFEIDDLDPFKNDLLERKKHIENLYNMLINITHPYVFCIDSPWGNGKTTFCRLFQKYFQNNNYPAIIFNAWKSDFQNNALLALITELETELSKLTYEDKLKRKITKSLKGIKTIGSNIVKNSVPLGIKIVTLGTVDVNDDFKKIITDSLKDYSGNQIDEFKDTIKYMEKFKSNLENVVELVKEDKNYNTPIFVFIDELDRCRPLYAIEVLEKVKHFFNIPGIIFILSIDIEQITYSIRSVYGSEMDVYGYLRRFIDLQYNLDNSNESNFIKHLFIQFKIHEIINIHPIERSRIYVAIDSIFNENVELMLRDKEQIISTLSIYLRSISEIDNPFFICIGIFLIVLKFTNLKLYKKIINLSFSLNEVFIEINKLIPAKRVIVIGNNTYSFKDSAQACFALSLEVSRRYSLSYSIVNTFKSDDFGKNKISERLDLTEEKKNIYRGLILRNDIVEIESIINKVSLLEKFSYV